MSLIKVKLTHSFSSVSDKIFSLKMKPASRLTLAWALGRPNNWEFYLEHMKKVLGLSEVQWRAVKKELILAGFFTQMRRNDAKGKTVWENNFFDAPLFEGLEIDKGTTIPPKHIDGETTHGETTHGEKGGITKDDLSKVLKTTNNEAVVVFLEAAGNPSELHGKGANVQKALGGSTIEQAHLAGLAYLATKNKKNPGGLAVDLCQKAAKGQLEPSLELSKEWQIGQLRNQAAARLKDLVGKEFKRDDGRIIKVVENGIEVLGKTLCFDFFMPICDAINIYLPKIESGEFPPHSGPT